MAKDHHDIETVRKIPTQERARVTFDAILEATAQILLKHGEAGLTTNAIATRAGVSVGTLYQYFPSKEAIMVALADDERQRIADLVSNHLRAPDTHDLECMIRRIIRTVLEEASAKQALRRMTVARILKMVLSGKFTSVTEKFTHEIRAYMNDAGMPENALSDTALFVLIRAILGNVRSAVFENPSLLSEPEFEEQLVVLATGFLRAQPRFSAVEEK